MNCEDELTVVTSFQSRDITVAMRVRIVGEVLQPALLASLPVHEGVASLLPHTGVPAFHNTHSFGSEVFDVASREVSVHHQATC